MSAQSQGIKTPAPQCNVVSTRAWRTRGELPVLGSGKANRNLKEPDFARFGGRRKERVLLRRSITYKQNHKIKWHIPKTASRSIHTILTCILKTQLKVNI